MYTLKILKGSLAAISWQGESSGRTFRTGGLNTAGVFTLADLVLCYCKMSVNSIQNHDGRNLSHQ